MSATPFERLVQHFEGSQAKAARALKRSPQVLSNWKRRGIPADAALDIELATQGSIPAAEVLRGERRA